MAADAVTPLLPLPPSPTLYRFFFTLTEDDRAACCGVGAEAFQTSIDHDTVRLVCLACHRTRTCESYLGEVVI